MRTIDSLLRDHCQNTSIIPGNANSGPISCSLLPRNAAKNPYKKIAVIMSHDDDYFEQATLLHLVSSLSRMPVEMPVVEILSADHKTDNLEINCLKYVARNAEKFSACITLSAWTTAQAFTHLPMRGVRLPLLFANVNDPQSLGIARFSVRSEYVAGIVTQTQDYRQQLLTMKDLLPSFERLIIPHDSLLREHQFSNIEYGNIASLIAECDDLGIKPALIGITPDTDIAHEISHMDRTGTVFAITRQSSLMVQSQKIVNAAVKTGIPIFADNPMPAIYGGAFGTGSSGALSANPLANLIYKIVVERKAPRTIPFSYVAGNPRLLYNQEHFAKQGITMDDRTRRLLEAQDVMTLWGEQI